MRRAWSTFSECGLHHQAGLGGIGAGIDEAGVGVFADLHQAQAALAFRGQIRVMAEGGDLEAVLPGGDQQALTRGGLDGDAVNGQAHFLAHGVKAFRQ